MVYIDRFIPELLVPDARYPPTRKIGIQTRSLTGTVPDSNRFESSLEGDFMVLVRNDPDFLSFNAQPVVVPMTKPDGRPARPYRPDGLVQWKSGKTAWLVEIKYRKDCSGQWRVLRRKFRAASDFAVARGWLFKVFSEDRIRGARLQNLQFLEDYGRRRVRPKIEDLVREAIASGKSTPADVVAEVASKGVGSADALPSLWRLIARREIQIDFGLKLTMTSKLWIGP